jgi:hypothetical protein
MNQWRPLLPKLGYAAAVGTCIFLLFFVIAVTWIGFEVKTTCRAAQAEYRGGCVEALVAQMKDGGRGFRPRNDAIWALGQLGDSRALPALQGLYTGSIPPREPLDAVISQYELRKAIDLTSGGANPLALLWRHGIERESAP